MKVLLIHPPHHNPKFAPFCAEPISLETIAGSVSHLDVDIVDLRLERYDPMSLVEKHRPDLVGITGNTVDLYNIRGIK